MTEVLLQDCSFLKVAVPGLTYTSMSDVCGLRGFVTQVVVMSQKTGWASL